ncbi:MAG: ATP-NAD kinase family protein [Candidatus Methanofastidiosia archaeon]
MVRIGFLINPIAGMGGRVGLKGTDGVAEKAKKLGAKQVSRKRAEEFVKNLKNQRHKNIEWMTCSFPMGADVLLKEGFDFRTIYAPKYPTVKDDTMNACRLFVKNKCELIVFCGGDGTARDVYKAVENKAHILGIPSGVKMLSGIFAINPAAAAELVSLFSVGKTSIKEADIVDLDENKYRKDNFSFKIFGIAKTIFEGNFLQSSKMLIEGPSEEDIKHDIAKTVIEDMDDKTLYLLGAGSTVKAIADALKIKKTLLGIDAVKNKKIVKKDLNEKGILELLEKNTQTKLMLSPLGAQGFVVGRGNLQLSPRIIKKIGIKNILIVSTPNKLKTIRQLLVDTGDNNLDKMFTDKRYFPVIIGYRTSAVKNIGLQNL